MNGAFHKVLFINLPAAEERQNVLSFASISEEDISLKQAGCTQGNKGWFKSIQSQVLNLSNLIFYDENPYTMPCLRKLSSTKIYNYNVSYEISKVLQHGFNNKTKFTTIEELTPEHLKK